MPIQLLMEIRKSGMQTQIRLTPPFLATHLKHVSLGQLPVK